MSMNTTVLCLLPLPARQGGWNLTVGPARIAERELEGDTERWASSALGLVYRAMAASVGDELARCLARAAGGVVLFENGREGREDFTRAPNPAKSAEELEERLRQVLDWAAEAEEARRVEAVRRYEAEAAAHPDAYQAASEWTDE